MKHGLSCSVACEIFLDQGLNRVPCTGRRILNHCTTREVPQTVKFLLAKFSKQLMTYTYHVPGSVLDL